MSLLDTFPPHERITPHQREVLDRLIRTYLRLRQPVLAKDIGSVAALSHLARKGYVGESVDYGPRGGRIVSVWPKYDARRNRVRLES